MDKRARSPAEGDESALVAVKRARGGDENAGALVVGAKGPSTPAGPKRTSGLYAPIMLLTGHGSEVFSMKFSPDGQSIVSGGHDRRLMLWRVYGQEPENYMMIEGHSNAITEVHWTKDGEKLVSSSVDKTVRAWDALTGEQLKKMREHEAIVNACQPLARGPPLIVSGDNNGVIKLYDLRQKRSAQTLTHSFPVLGVAFGIDGDVVYSAGVDNDIQQWDLRTGEVSLTMTGHSDSVTGIKVSPDGTHLLSNAMDNTLRTWDLRPYAPKNRNTKIFTGHIHNYEKNLLKCDWSPDGSKVACGSGDRMVYTWEVNSRKMLYRLPGHQGSVNEVVFHPSEPIIGSAGSDKQIYLGEIAL